MLKSQTERPLRPRIGMTSNFMHADPERALFRGKTLQYMEERLALAIWRAGGMPVVLPDLKDEDGRRAVMDALDGLVLTGGADVSPLSYGETPLRPAWAGDPVRDAYETHLVELALAARLPVLGVCRGIQVLNVALGGSLWQDLETQLPRALVHRDWHRYDELGHPIEVSGASWIGSVYDGATQIHVNSVHHQGLRRLGDGLVPTAWAPDGVVEAVECVGAGRFLVGVQWHPEWLENDRVGPGGDVEGWAPGGAVFSAFLGVCRGDRAER